MPNQIVKVIPDADLQLAADPDGPPPASLIEALREFVIGPASLLSQGRASTRSMLVHPSRLTGPHAAFVRWVRAVVDLWRGAFEDETDAESLKEQFRGAWESINSTDSDLPGFEACWGNVRFVLRNLQLIEMNARDQQTPVIDWDPTMSYVLVGGQALDRGFTINGLSVTYMNRDGGSWTADTIQQRTHSSGTSGSFSDSVVSTSSRMCGEHSRPTWNTNLTCSTASEVSKAGDQLSRSGNENFCWRQVCVPPAAQSRRYPPFR